MKRADIIAHLVNEENIKRAEAHEFWIDHADAIELADDMREFWPVGAQLEQVVDLMATGVVMMLGWRIRTTV